MTLAGNLRTMDTLTLTAAAEHLGVETSELLHLVHRGEVAAVTVDGRLQIPRDVVEQLAGQR